MRISNKELIEAISERYDIEEEVIRKVLRSFKEYVYEFLIGVNDDEVNETYPIDGIKMYSKITDHNKKNGTVTVKATLTERCKARLNKERKRLYQDF